MSRIVENILPVSYEQMYEYKTIFDEEAMIDFLGREHPPDPGGEKAAGLGGRSGDHTALFQEKEGTNAQAEKALNHWDRMFFTF